MQRVNSANVQSCHWNLTKSLATRWTSHPKGANERERGTQPEQQSRESCTYGINAICLSVVSPLFNRNIHPRAHASSYNIYSTIFRFVFSIPFANVFFSGTNYAFRANYSYSLFYNVCICSTHNALAIWMHVVCEPCIYGATELAALRAFCSRVRIGWTGRRVNCTDLHFFSFFCLIRRWCCVDSAWIVILNSFFLRFFFFVS